MWARIDAYDKYRSHEKNINRKIKFDKQFQDDFYTKLFDPNKPIVMLKYNDGSSGKVNIFELEQISKFVKEIWDHELTVEDKDYDSLKSFFTKAIGVVVTHTAQRVLLQNKLIEIFDEEIEKSDLNEKNIKSLIKSSVDTVEKYQGQEREIMIGSFVVGETELINSEAEFLYNPNRLNVMLSRAKSKFILLVSNEFLNNNPNDYDRLEDQKAILKLNEFCSEKISLEHEDWIHNDRDGVMSYKRF